MQSIIILTLAHSIIQYINLYIFVIHYFTIHNVLTTINLHLLQYDTGMTPYVFCNYQINGLAFFVKNKCTYIQVFQEITHYQSQCHVLGNILLSIIILCIFFFYSNIITDSPHLLTHKQWIDRPYCNRSLRGELSER